jgi:hypothetical protein
MAAFAQWHDMNGFFVGRESAYDAYENPAEEPLALRMTLGGFEWLDRSTHTLRLPAAVLEVIGSGGHTLGDYALWDADLAVPPGSSQATLAARVEALPHVGGEWAWDRWRAGRPDRPGGWAGLPVGEREAWLEVARAVALRESRTAYPMLRQEHHIDGSRIDDLASFFCAIGEALAGPGGYCGSSFADLSDCLRYSVRSVARPRLVWRDMAVAEKSLERLLDVAVGTMAAGAVDVVPA